MFDADLQITIRTWKTACAEIELHREDAVCDIYASFRERDRRTHRYLIAEAHCIPECEPQIISSVGRRAAVRQATLIVNVGLCARNVRGERQQCGQER